MDAIIKSFPKAPLTDHVHNAPQPVVPQPSRQEAEAAVRTLIAYIGDDPTREGLLDTPSRFVNAYEEIFHGYRDCPADVLDRTFSEIETYDELVVIRDIPFYSHCEHHIMPFSGKAHVAYRPVSSVVGLSKIARLIDAYGKRLQTQERLTSQIATAIEMVLKPHGVAVMLEAEHSCMSQRGVQKVGSRTVTAQFTGTFRHDQAEQMRFMTLVRGSQS